MLSVLLLPLVALLAPPAGPGVAAKDDPTIQLWISNDRRFFPGDRAKVHVRTEQDGYLLVLHADPDGYLRVLFPIDPRDDNFVRGGRKYEVEGRGGREAFDVDARSGRGTVYAAVSAVPFQFDQFVLGDHWDYRKLAPNRLPREPETELTELVRQMAQGDYDYDILGYDVIERVYASDYSYSRSYYGPRYYGSAYYDDWCGWSYYDSCNSFSVGIFFGRPYRRFYYGPYYAYSPFYDPFFYDPYYYHSRYYYYPGYYYRPYHYYRPYYSYPYRSAYFPRYRDRVYGYTPYRFRGFGDTPYRDRRYTFGRAVNTVYTPPVSRFATSDNSSPMRRAIGDDGSAQPRRRGLSSDAVEPRRAGERRDEAAGGGRRAEPARERAAPNVDRRRMDTRDPVEARRAREPERTRGIMSDARESRDLPREIRPSSRSGERPRAERAPIRDDSREARRADRADEPRSAARGERREEPRYEPRSEPRSSGSRSDAGPSRGGGGGGGGDRPSGGRGGGGGGGRRR